MTSIISSIHYITRRSPAMEPITASICFFVMTGGMAGVAMYEHDKIIRYIKVAEKRQQIIDKMRKDLTRGK
ncbi:MAG: hypothetical protein ACOVNU_00885 [Candidatus Kapaibacteriota bacterium]|jgi:hypothetical protein